MRYLSLLLAAMLPAVAWAQDDPFAPPTTRPPDLTCQNWNAQKRGGDPALMAELAGIWEADGVIPATPGVIGATPEHTRVTQWANGQLTYERSACFHPIGLQPACAQSIGHGEWFAYPADDNGWFFYASALAGSGYNGMALPPSCGGGYARLRDANTSESANGAIARRTGAAP